MSKVRAVTEKTTLDRIVSRISASKVRNKEAGFFEITRTSKEILSRVRYVLRTGIEPWDAATGGMPFGRIVELYGLESCGKTAMAIRSVVRAQQKHIYEITDKGWVLVDPKKIVVTLLYIDNEQSLPDDDKIVVDGQTIDAALGRCDTIDQLFKMIDITIEGIQEIQKEEDDEETGIKHFLVCVVDTISSTSSKEEMTAEWGKDDYSRQPKALRLGFRRMSREINRQNVLLICTNQVSDNLKASAGGKRPRSNTPMDADFVSYGGKALKYYASLRVFMFKLRDYKLIKESKFPAGFLIGFCTIKNRQTKPVRSGRMVLLFDRGFSNVFSILEHLIFMDFAEVSESGKISFKFSTFGIETKTFSSEKKTSLEEDDERGSRVKNPSISTRSEWPALYDAHKSDFEVLLQKATEAMFAMEGLDDAAVSSEREAVEMDVIEDDEEN